MRQIIYTLFLLGLQQMMFAQDKLVTKTGKVHFEASVATFEEVKADLNNAACALNTKTGDLAVILFIKSFKFKNGLMQEHFNENYMESDKYPKAIFIGKIQNFDWSNLSGSSVKLTAAGSIEIHGKKRNITIPITINKNDSKLNLATAFQLSPEDFDIEIPSIVGYKIAKTVSIKSEFVLN
jgi:polyisoprenoid-binding protein YceI